MLTGGIYVLDHAFMHSCCCNSDLQCVSICYWPDQIRLLWFMERGGIFMNDDLKPCTFKMNGDCFARTPEGKCSILKDTTFRRYKECPFRKTCAQVRAEDPRFFDRRFEE